MSREVLGEVRHPYADLDTFLDEMMKTHLHTTPGYIETATLQKLEGTALAEGKAPK